MVYLGEGEGSPLEGKLEGGVVLGGGAGEGEVEEPRVGGVQNPEAVRRALCLQNGPNLRRTSRRKKAQRGTRRGVHGPHICIPSSINRQQESTTVEGDALGARVQYSSSPITQGQIDLHTVLYAMRMTPYLAIDHDELPVVRRPPVGVHRGDPYVRVEDGPVGPEGLVLDDERDLVLAAGERQVALQSLGVPDDVQPRQACRQADGGYNDAVTVLGNMRLLN